MSPEDLKKTKERERRSGSVDIPRNIPPEVLNQPNGPGEVQRFLTPGSFAYAAALSDTTPAPAPAAPCDFIAIALHRYQLLYLLVRDTDPIRQEARFAALEALYPPATLGGL